MATILYWDEVDGEQKEREATPYEDAEFTAQAAAAGIAEEENSDGEEPA